MSKKDLVNNTATVDFSKGGIYTFLMSSGGKKFSIFDIDLFWRSFGQELSVGLINTLKLSLIAFAIGICIGLIMGLGRVSSNVVFKTLSSIYVEGIRGLPLLLQLLFAYYAIPFMWTDLTGRRIAHRRLYSLSARAVREQRLLYGRDLQGWHRSHT